MKLINRAKASNGFGTFYKVEDAGEVYWITEKSLHSKIVLDELLKSGYKIIGYPYNITLSGDRIDSLPETAIDDNSIEEAMLIESSSEMYSQQEVMGKVDTQAFVSDVPHDYRIQTKEELIDFLYSTESLAELPYPLNYVVAPSARLRVEDILPNERYEDFFNKLLKRLSMSYKQFKALRSFLEENGLKKDCTVNDFLMKYFEWGVDGLTYDTSSRSIAEIYNNHYIPASRVSETGTYITRVGIVNPQNNFIIESDGAWAPLQSIEYVNKQKSKLKNSNEYVAVEMRQLRPVDEIVYTSTPFPMHVSAYGMLLGGYMLPGLQVFTDDESRSLIPMDILFNEERVKEYTMLCASARELLNKTKVFTDASTYKVCKSIGMDDIGAVTYVYDQLEDDTEYVSYETAAAYYEDPESELVTPDAVTRIANVEDGSLNIGVIDGTLRSESVQTANNILLSLRAANERLHIPVDEIMEKVNAYKVEDGDLVLEKDGKSLITYLPKLDGTIDAFDYDRFELMAQAARDSVILYHIIAVGSEYVNKRKMSGANYHVAAMGYCIDKTKHKSSYENLINTIFDMIKVSYPHKEELDQLNECKHAIITGALFRLYLTGELEIKEIDLKLPVTPAISSAVFNMMEPFAASVAALSSKIYYYGNFHYYCTNAVVTPTRVYVKYGETPIPRMHIKLYWSPELWQMNEVWQQKYSEYVAQGYFPKGFRWFGSVVNTVDIRPAQHSFTLLKYIEDAEISYMETPENKVFVRAPRTIALTCIAMSGVEEGDEDVIYVDRKPEDPAGMAILEAGKIEYVEDIQKVSIIKEDLTKPKRYAGSDFQTLYMTGKCFDASDVKETGKRLVMVGDSLVDPDADKTFTLSQLPTMEAEGYAVKNIFGRRFLFEDLYGDLYEVEV